MAVLLNRVGEVRDDAGTIRVARVDLWKRRWRGTASDGTEVAVALDEAAKDGQCLYGEEECFQIVQTSEEVVAIPMPDDSEMAAKIGWYLGNRHIPIEVRAEELVMENFPTLTGSLTKIGIPHEVREDVLRCRPHSSDHRH